VRARDNFTFAAYGDWGIGRYIMELRALGGQDAVYNPERESLEPLRDGAAYLGFQHWWSLDRRIRSTFTYGFTPVRNLDIQPDEALSSTHRWSLNLSWSPIVRVDLVAEYLFGNRKNTNGELGWSNQLQIGGAFRGSEPTGRVVSNFSVVARRPGDLMASKSSRRCERVGWVSRAWRSGFVTWGDRFELTSRPGAGTEVRAWVPLDAAVTKEESDEKETSSRR
jgi:hypothetical protein